MLTSEKNKTPARDPAIRKAPLQGPAKEPVRREPPVTPESPKNEIEDPRPAGQPDRALVASLLGQVSRRVLERIQRFNAQTSA